MVLSTRMDQVESMYFAAEVIFSAVGSTLTRNRATNLDNFGSSIVHSSSTFREETPINKDT